MRVALAAILSGCFAIGASAAQATQLDAQLQAAATAQQPAVIQTLRELVTVESGSTDHEGVAKLMTYLDKRLLALDAKVERVASAAGGPVEAAAAPADA